LDARLCSEAGRAEYWGALLEQCRRFSVISLLQSTLHLEGDIIECGVYRGKSLFRLCRELKNRSAQKMVYACDSFAGFPASRLRAFDRTLFRPLRKLRAKFRLADDVPRRLHQFGKYYDVQVAVVQGWFEETLPKLPVEKFCFIHLDVDIYESYRECLEYLYPRLVPGGVVVFDDYASSRWPGARKAVDEFFADRGVSVEESTEREKPAWFVRKPAAR